MNLLRVLVCFTACAGVVLARPWNTTSPEPMYFDVQQMSSPLITTIDSMTSGFSRILKTSSPTLTPLLGAATLTYVAYIGSVMYFPKVLSEAGLPLLDDFRMEARNIRASESSSSSSGFIDSLATGFMKDMIGRTEAADVLRNTSTGAVRSGLGTLKRTSRFLHSGLGDFGRMLGDAMTALTPGCVARTMCRIGQVTSLHMPAIGPMLRSIDSFGLDDFSQALIDGTTVGDCSAVYHECPL